MCHQGHLLLLLFMSCIINYISTVLPFLCGENLCFTFCPVCCSVSAVSLQGHRLGRCGCWIEVPFVGTTQFGHQHCQERREQNPRCSLTLGAHAQQGLQYLVCQSFRPSVRYHLFWHYAQQGGQEAIPTGSVPHWLDF